MPDEPNRNFGALLLIKIHVPDRLLELYCQVTGRRVDIVKLALRQVHRKRVDLVLNIRGAVQESLPVAAVNVGLGTHIGLLRSRPSEPQGRAWVLHNDVHLPRVLADVRGVKPTLAIFIRTAQDPDLLALHKRVLSAHGCLVAGVGRVLVACERVPVGGRECGWVGASAGQIVFCGCGVSVRLRGSRTRARF